MPNNYDENNHSTNNEPTIIKTDIGVEDGQTKCPQCGATIQPHRVCTKCGYYKGNEVIKVTEEETTEE